MGSEGGLSGRHGTCKGEVGEEGVQGGEMMRERERMGLGSDTADKAHVRERRGERGGGESVSEGEGGSEGGPRGQHGAREGEVSEAGGPRQRCGKGEGEVGFEGGSSSRHGAREGEVGEEAVRGGETTREREMRGLGSDTANTARVRERREAAAASRRVGERRREGIRRGSEGPIRCA